MGSTAEKVYSAFEAKVKRTVLIDNLSPMVTETVIRSALDQYGRVVKVQIIPNYTEPSNFARCALVELENHNQASTVMEELNAFPFMISGMPRPVRARAAQPEMFDDRPAKPGQKIHLYWLDPKDPDFGTARKLKELTNKQYAEAQLLLQRHVEEEEKLSKHQKEALQAVGQKYDKLDSVLTDSNTNRLARHYSVKLTEDTGGL